MPMGNDRPTLLRIRDLRIAKGWTQRDLAERAGLARGYISDIENGQRAFNARTLDSIAKALGVRPGDLLSEIVIDHHEMSVDEVLRLILSLNPENRSAALNMLRGLLRSQSQREDE